MYDLHIPVLYHTVDISLHHRNPGITSPISGQHWNNDVLVSLFVKQYRFIKQLLHRPDYAIIFDPLHGPPQFMQRTNTQKV